MPYNPGLGQGHGKKRHLHAHSPVNFKELKCYKKISFVLQLSDMFLRVFIHNLHLLLHYTI